MTKTCGNCAYWHPLFTNSSNIKGSCRFNPPTVTNYDGFRDSAWPTTNSNNWCGKFVMKDETNELG